MKLPAVVSDGHQTAIAVSRPAAGHWKLLRHVGGGKLALEIQNDAGWAPVEGYPVGLKIALYKDMYGAIMQAREVESLLAKLAGDRSLAYDLTKFNTNRLERTMSDTKTAAAKPAANKAAATKAPTKAPAKKEDVKAASRTSATKDAKPAAAAGAKKASTAKPAAAAPAKPAAAAPAEGRKGRPSSLDASAKILKGEHKVKDFVREGSVREALMNAIVESKTVGEALGKTLKSGHTVKSVDVHFAIEQGYIKLSK